MGINRNIKGTHYAPFLTGAVLLGAAFFVAEASAQAVLIPCKPWKGYVDFAERVHQQTIKHTGDRIGGRATLHVFVSPNGSWSVATKFKQGEKDCVAVHVRGDNWREEQ